MVEWAGPHNGDRQLGPPCVGIREMLAREGGDEEDDCRETSSAHGGGAKGE